MTLLLALLIGAAPISANERVGAVVVVLAPSEVRLRLPVSALLSAAEQALGAGTSLAFRSTEQAGVDLGQLDGCDPRARYQCWLHAIEATPAIRIMITVAVLPLGPARDRFSVTALDVADVPPGFGAIEEAEETLSERALIAASVELDSGAPGAMAKLFEVIAPELEAWLATRGLATPLGAIAISGAGLGAPLALDGVVIGVSAVGTTTITDVRPGRRALAAGGRAFAVEVSAGGVARIALDPIVPERAFGPSRWVLVGVGALAVVTGSALIVAGASQADLRQGCLVRANQVADCPALGAPTFGYDRDLAPSLDPEAVNPSGIALAPLGLALLTGGTTWAGGAVFTPFDELWISVAGLAFGAITFLVASLAGGG